MAYNKRTSEEWLKIEEQMKEHIANGMTMSKALGVLGVSDGLFRNAMGRIRGVAVKAADYGLTRNGKGLVNKPATPVKGFTKFVPEGGIAADEVKITLVSGATITLNGTARLGEIVGILNQGA